MKKLFLLTSICSIVFGFVANGFAEPYKSKEFPPNGVLANYFKTRSFTVIGKTQLSEHTYKVYFQIKTSPELYTGPPVLCDGTVRKLDTDIWIGEEVNIGTNAEILQK